MRKFKLSAALAVTLMGGAVASAGVIGTLSITGQRDASDATPTIHRAASSQVFVDGRVPVRVQAVVDGALVQAARAAVTFARHGEVVYRADEIDGGTIQAEGLADGGYSVMISGKDGFAAFATWVDSASDGDPTDDSFISVALVPASDMPTVRRLIRTRQVAVRPPTDEDDGLVSTPASPVTTRSTRSLSHGAGLTLSADGILRGRVIRNVQDHEKAVPLRQSQVTFVRDNEIVGEALSDADGMFDLGGLTSGVYSLVVTNSESFVALSVDVAPAPANVASGTVVNEFSLVSAAGEPAVPDVEMIYPDDAYLFDQNDNIFADELAADPTQYAGGGGFGGGSGGAAGGGGFGGGGPGLGALLLGAGLGAGIYAIADDNHGGGGGVVSPTAP